MIHGGTLILVPIPARGVALLPRISLRSVYLRSTFGYSQHFLQGVNYYLNLGCRRRPPRLCCAISCAPPDSPCTGSRPRSTLSFMQPTNGQPATDEPTFRPLDHRPDHDRPTTRRATVAEAAVLLGISEDAVRSRLKRGTLGKEKAKDGTVLVVLGEGGSTDRPTQGGDQPTTGQPTDQPTDEATDQEELVEALQQRIEHLSRIIDTRDEEIRRRDTIIMSLTQRIPELEAPSETRDAPETVSEGEDRGEAPPEPQEPVERRSWWRRFFGFE